MPDSPSHSDSPMPGTAETKSPTTAAEADAKDKSSETQKLISTIKEAFDALKKTNAEQSDSLTATLERLSAVVQGLKQQPQSESLDKKTAFWTVYGKLADEFDKQFQHKYGNDLDTSLIFAGLFSAVSSSFIIQIQPELQPDPNAVTQALLLVLVQNMTGAAIMGPTPERLVAPTIIVVAQSLLYFSLFSTLMAGLLAVLGKQWLLHYDSVGERGTIEERGIERQRKFDGLLRWKFDLVMQIFPLLLQHSLLLFATALSIYLWTIHHAIAAIVLGLTSIGVILYILMSVSALTSPDSPFQTPLTILLAALIKVQKSLAARIIGSIPAPITDSLREFWGATGDLLSRISGPLNGLISRAGKNCCHFLKTIPTLLPVFNRPTPPLAAQPALLFDIPSPSKAVPAIVWALETSTDPKIVEAAAALVPDNQWPVNLGLRLSLIRLADIFNGCFDNLKIRDGMNERAIRCIRAFGLLEMVTVRGEDWTDPWTFKYRSWMQADSELQSMAKYLRVSGFGWPDGRAITRWSLCFLPGQALDEDYLEIILDQFQPDAASVDDLSLYTDFVFCINSYFAPPSVHNLSQMDKSDHCVLLTTLLFENLAKRLTDTKPLALDITREIIDKIAGFTFSSGLLGGDIRGREAVHRFCAVPNVGIPSIVSALRLVRLDQLTLERIATNVNPMANVAWVHSTLEELYALRPSDPTVITDLLQVLVHHGGVPTKISAAALDVILWGISFDVADATAYLVLILPRVHHWFQDGELRPILRDRMMWPILGKAVPRPGYLLLYPEAVQRMVASYISLGDKLSQTQEWKPVIADDLPGWLGTLSRLLSAHGMDEETRQQFCAVLSRVWDVAPTEPRPEKDPECLVMAFQALTDAWDQFDFSNSQGTHRLLALIECTVLTAFCARIVVWPLPTPISVSDHFEEIVMPRLADAVEQAAERLELAQNTFAADQDLLTGAAGLMLTLASIITGELRRELPRAVDEYDHWCELRRPFDDALETLRETSHATGS